MSFNLVDLITEQVGNQVVKQMGGILGASESQTQTAVSGAIPALLGGLLGQSSTPAGASGIVGALEGLDDGILGNFGTMLGGDKSADLLKLGGSLLGSSLGGNNLSSLAGAIAGFSGLNKGASNSLLGMLAPLALGLMKKQLLGSGGLNASNLTSMLTGQRQNIAAAMPTGLGERLGAANLPGMEGLLADLGNLGNASKQAAASVSSTVSSTASAATNRATEAAGTATRNVASAGRAAATTAADTTAAAGNSLSKYLIPGIIALALIVLGFMLFGNRGRQAVSDAANAVQDTAENAADAAGDAVGAATEAAGNAANAATDAASNAAEAVGDAANASTDAAGDAVGAATGAAGDAANALGDAANAGLEAFAGLDDLVIGDLNLGQELGGAFGSISGVLAGITDTETATDALPALTEATEQLEGLAGNLGELSDTQREAVADAATNGMAGIQGILNTLTEIPGVGDIIQPVVDQLMSVIAQFIG